MIFSIRDLSFELGYSAGGLARLCCPGRLRSAHSACGMARAPLAAAQGLPRPGGTQLAFHRHAHPAAQLCGARAAHVPGGGHLLAASSLPWAIPGVRKLFLMALPDGHDPVVCEGLYQLLRWPTCCWHPAARRSAPTRPCSPCWTPPTRCWSFSGRGRRCAGGGFPIGSIVAGAGLIGLTISLAAQESASNLFSGIVILLDKPFRWATGSPWAMWKAK